LVGSDIITNSRKKERKEEEDDEKQAQAIEKFPHSH
jgi:hypothetical protein